MPVARHTQTSLSAGEFDPLLWSREDVSFFYNSARIIENCVSLPQGGIKRREGWPFRGLQRGETAAINISGATPTAPEGGTAANGIDGDAATLVTSTTAIGVLNSYTLFKLDLGSDTRVSMIDVQGLKFIGLPVGVTQAKVFIDSSTDDIAYTTRAEVNVGDLSFDRRFALAPDTDLATARYWRVRVDRDGQDMTTAVAELGEVLFWTEAGKSAGAPDLTEFSVHRLTTSITSEYILYATNRNIDVYTATDGVWQAAISIPHADLEVANLKYSSNLDTAILYHEDVITTTVQKLGSDTDWHSSPLVFDDVVEFPFGDANVAGGVNEIQYVEFVALGAGTKIVIELNGQTSDEVIIVATVATNVANFEAAIESLDAITSVTVTTEPVGTNNIAIEFVGVDGKKPWPILIFDILTTTATAEISHKQYGKEDFDLLWSPTRGFARCGAFYQGRHWMGGFKARPDLIVGSRAGGLFEFKQDAEPVAGSPIVIAPNVEDQITILNLYAGRHLQIFTSSAEMYIPSEPITVDNIALKSTSRHGSNAQTQPVDIQGGTLFVDRNGRALREYLFTDSEQSYSAEPISILAGHLLASPKNIVLRRARDVDEPTLLLVSNTGVDRSGVTVPAAMIVIDRAQQITGFMRIATLGTPKAFASSQAGEAFAVTSRDLDGVEWNYFEQFEEGKMSDAGVSIAGAGSTADVSVVAPHLNNQVVEVHADGLPIGSYTVSGAGIVDISPNAYATTIEIGLRMVPRIVLHPFKGKGDTSPTMQNMRIFRTLLQLERTGAIAIASGGRSPKQVSLLNHDSGLMDPTLEEVLFTGTKRISGMGSWQKEPTIEITQVEPMPFLLRSLTYDVRF